MTVSTVRIDLVHLDGCAVLAVVGEIDIASAAELQDALAWVSISNVPIVLDFAGVTFMDSAGIQALLSACPAGREGAGSIVIRNAQRQVQLVLKVTGLDWLLEQKPRHAA